LHKKIEFNLVNQNYLHLNSNILLQLINVKLKKRKNSILKVLSFLFRSLQLPFLNKLSERFSVVNKKEDNFLSKANSLNYYNNVLLFKANNLIEDQKKDFLNQTLQQIFQKQEKEKFKNKSEYINVDKKQNKKENKKNINEKKESFIKNNLENTILNTIKHKTISGVRLEASGRLTRRLIAARSIYKLRYKGTIKNIDSSYKKLSTVILRGHVKSNIQYTKISSKTRIGSFGLKG
jgi:FKBP-type peptidyl-prolyl cis-trans isomerase